MNKLLKYIITAITITFWLFISLYILLLFTMNINYSDSNAIAIQTSLEIAWFVIFISGSGLFVYFFLFKNKKTNH